MSSSSITTADPARSRSGDERDAEIVGRRARRPDGDLAQLPSEMALAMVRMLTHRVPLADEPGMPHAGQVSGLTQEVARASSTTEAHLIVGMLEANGIAARASADDAGGLEPQWQLTEGVRVFVAFEDAAEAQRLVAEATSGPE